jgi:hypothetical protein
LVQLEAVDDAAAGGALVDVVEEVPDDLVGGEQCEQARAAGAGQDREQRGAVDVGALFGDGVQRVLANACVGNAGDQAMPVAYLAGDGG